MNRNEEKIRRLADLVEACQDVTTDDHEPNSGPAFSMAQTWYECGSPACLLGHNHAMHGRTMRSIQVTQGYYPLGPSHNNVVALAEDLGLTYAQAVELGMPEHSHAHYARKPGSSGWITAEHAGAVLRNLADEGKVEWDIFGP